MKLQKIIDTHNRDGLLKSITIDVRTSYTVCSIFKKHHAKPILKVYRTFNVGDYEIRETNAYTVEHLGIKKYYHKVNKNFFINLYYWN